MPDMIGIGVVKVHSREVGKGYIRRQQMPLPIWVIQKIGQINCVIQRENTTPSTNQSRQMGTNAKPVTNIMRQTTDIGPRATDHIQRKLWWRPIDYIK